MNEIGKIIEMKKLLSFGLLCLLGIFLVTGGCRRESSTTSIDKTCDLPQRKKEMHLEESLQMVVVSVPDLKNCDAVVRCCGRENVQQTWSEELPPMPALIGRNGLAEPGEKKEGDGKTPSGEFGIVTAFGRDAEPPQDVGFPYRQATENDFWIDDPDSPDYNRWVTGERPGVSHENLRLADEIPVYDLALTLDFNTEPVVPGAGSAIFLHIWFDERTPTSGCVALSRENVLEILRWLDAEKKPRIKIQLQK